LRNKVFKYTGLVLFVSIGVVPFFSAFIYALLYSLGIIGTLNDGFTLLFWEEVLSSGEFVSSFLYSTLVAAVALFISVGGALWTVIKFKKNLDGKFLSFVMYLPLAIPGVVAAFFTRQLFSQGGFFARVSYQLGWIAKPSEFPDVVNDALAIGIILTFVTIVMPFFTLLFLNVYKNERIAELSVLAKSLGANAKQVTLRVCLPILLKKTWVLIALYFIFLLGAYEVPLILGRESPQMLSVLIIRETRQFDLSKISEGYVIAVMYTIVVSVAAIILFLPKRKKVYEN
jgi:putative spermidine/putrescine transport system permease protein